MDKASKERALSPVLTAEAEIGTDIGTGLLAALGGKVPTIVEFDCFVFRPRLISMATSVYLGYCFDSETQKALESLHSASGHLPPHTVRFTHKRLYQRAKELTKKIARADIVCVDSLRLSNFVSEGSTFKQTVAKELGNLHQFGKKVVAHTILADENGIDKAVNLSELWGSVGLKREPPLYKNLEFLTAADYREIAAAKGLVMEGPFEGEVYVYEGVTLTTSYLAFTEKS